MTYIPSTPSANGSRVPPCPIFTISLANLRFLPVGIGFFGILLSSTNIREVTMSCLMSLTTDIEVGPEGFATANSPETGKEERAFGIV